jgi:GC-rich sequence DNA-binding factor
MPVLQKIEKDMMLHYKERHDIYTKRRLQDDADDLALCVGIVAPTEADEEEEVDELGRTRRKVDESGAYSGVRRARREERAARRQRRNARKPTSRTEEDGYSTDSSLGEGDAEDYQMAQAALQARVQALSSDVKAEDFRDPELGLAVRFGGWRKQYEDEYSNAYGGLAMVQGWEYWARQEMVGWEPSRVSRRPKGRIIAEPNSRRAVVIQIARLVPLVRLLAPLFPSQDGRYARRGFG